MSHPPAPHIPPPAYAPETAPILSDSPIHFFVSRYAIAMVAMVIITNRIQHVCTPYGRPARITPTERVLLRVPSIAMLSYALFRLLQALCADTTTPTAQAWLQYVRPWVPQTTQPMAPDSLLWLALLSACVAQCVSTAVRSLELTSAQDDPSTFNLVGFGFILYIHAHARQFAPNAHVYLIVLARIVELLGMNVLLCRRPPLVSRLVFTMVLSTVMTVHYVYTAVQSDEYPIIHSGGRLMEVCILGMIALTLALHLLTMYFVDRRVDLHRLFFHRSSLPRRTDDFSLAVLKLGTACLHATKLTGFSCELQTLDTPLRTYVELRPDGSTVIENSVEDLEQMDSHTYHPLEHEIKDLRVVLEHTGVEMGGVVRGADKMRALGHFFQTLLEIGWTVAREGATYAARYLPAPPAWVHHLPRYARLFWHGTNGEAERDARLAREAAQRAEAQKAHTRMEELRARRAERALHTDDEDDADLDATQLVALAQQDQGAEATAFQDVLVKHMLRADAAPPLTRRAYARLAAPATSAPTATASGVDAWLPALTRRSDDPSDRQTRTALLHLLQ
ncbi:hypothetical protein CBS9595_002953 [Malassezia furfur]|nr:hypothetical protein CBS9595_002953 [Malassezia furfur]